MPTPTTTKGLFAALTKMADEIVQEKQAAVKSAAPSPADPGQIDGSSSHPSASVDNGCQPAKEGERSSENEADVKKQQREPSVNSTADAKPGDDKDNSMNLGMTASLPGDDPSVEDDYKDKKDDPGTTHPADVSDNQKYGSLNLKQASAEAINVANALLADIGLGYAKNLGKQAAAPVAKPAAAAPAAPKTAAAAPAAAMLAGYDLAASLGLNKTAAEQQVASVIENSIKEAHERADLFGGFITKLAADEEAAEGEDHTGGGGAPEAGGSGAGDAEGAGGPSGGAGGGGGGGGGIESMLGGGGAPAPAGDPMGGGMAGGGQDAALQELVAALTELGITPEMLAQAGQAGGAGGGGAMPPPGGGDPMAALGGGGGGAMPPPAADPMMGGAPPAGDPMKVAMLARNFMRSGKYQVKEASTKEARQLRDQMKRMILEMYR